MKKFLSIFLTMTLLLCTLCSVSSAESLEGSSLEIAFNLTGNQLEVFEQLAADFAEQTGVNVTVSTYGDDYESTMKTRMAANDLPDIWTTHGWSVLRYSEYLMPLNDQPWVDEMNELATNVISDQDGNIYVLMIDAQINATLVDMTVCNVVGVDPLTIHSWDDFTAACAKIKEAGYTPIGNPNAAGNLANIAGSWLVYDGEVMDCADSLLDGTFDWNNFLVELKVWQDWYNKGYTYEDKASISTNDIQERWAKDEAAFYLGVNTNFPINTKVLNPDGDYIFIPTPASTDDGQMSAMVGEGNAFGIWKDTKNEAAAKAFLSYMATADAASVLTANTGYISCLDNVKDLTQDQYAQGLINDMQANFTNVAYENFFDREYMPSGMWSIFLNADQMLSSDWSDSGLNDIVEYLSDNYSDLYEIAHEDD